jgi:hypothetical protein
MPCCPKAAKWKISRLASANRTGNGRMPKHLFEMWLINFFFENKQADAKNTFKKNRHLILTCKTARCNMNETAEIICFQPGHNETLQIRKKCFVGIFGENFKWRIE